MQCAALSAFWSCEKHAGQAAHRAWPHRRLTLGVEISQKASQTNGNAMMLCARTYAVIKAKMRWWIIAVGSPSSLKCLARHTAYVQVWLEPCWSKVERGEQRSNISLLGKRTRACT